MAAADYVRTDTAEDAVSSFEVASDFYAQALADDRYWKWFVVAVHAGVQGTFALALDGGNGLLVQKPGVAKATLAAYEQGSEVPESHMDNFMRLYRKLHAKENLRSASAQPLPESPQNELALERLNDLRDNFIHFNTKSWSVERALIETRVRGSLKVAQFVLFESEAVPWYEDDLKERAHVALKRLSEQLGAETSYLHPVSSTTSKNADVEQAGRDDAGEA
jgi:hypothetical protein